MFTTILYGFGMIWLELTRTDAVFSRTAMVLFYVQKIKILGISWNSTEHLRKTIKNPCQRWRLGGPHPVHEGRGRPPGCAPYLMGPLVALRRQVQLHILAFGEKKIREKKSSCFTIWSRRQALISLGRLIWNLFGAPERGIRRRRHHQPSSITNFMMLTVVCE